MPAILLTFLSKYWKHLTILGISAILFIAGYYKGHKACELKDIKEVQKETEKRTERAYKEEDRIRKVKQKYNEDRKVNPINDGRDSCILSNDPFDVDCLKK